MKSQKPRAEKQDPFDREVAIEGWKAIAKIFGVSVDYMISRKDELISCGAIFYLTKGRPPKRHRVVCAFPSALRIWAQLKSIKGGF